MDDAILKTLDIIKDRIQAHALIGRKEF
jgi:hypothetical protein